MSEKRNTQKKQAPKTKETKKVSQVEKQVEVKEAPNYTELLNKILICLYALIAILVINTTILLVKDGSTTSPSSSSGSESENIDYDVSMFTTVTADTLEDAVEGDTAKIVYIGRDSCGYCVQFLPILQQAQEDYEYETLYLDITTVTTTEQQDKILAFDNEEEFLKQNFGGTPMVLLMKDGKMIDTWMGYADYSTYVAWLEENGFAEKE